jgi:hypothetical protein
MVRDHAYQPPLVFAGGDLRVVGRPGSPLVGAEAFQEGRKCHVAALQVGSKRFGSAHVTILNLSGRTPG